MTSTRKYETAGRNAYAAGLPSFPMSDPIVYAAIKDLAVGAGAMQIMKAWGRGWTAANLADDSE